MNLKIEPTDRLFTDSPDAGDPGCLCSRCGGAITEEEVPVRFFRGHAEYRFHPRCLEERAGENGADKHLLHGPRRCRARSRRGESGRRPPPARRSAALRNEFIQGLACGAAYIARECDRPTMAAGMIAEMGYTYADLKKAGVDPYDLEPLRTELLAIARRSG